MKTLTDVFFGGISPVDQLTGIIEQSGLKVMTQKEIDIKVLEDQGFDNVEEDAKEGYWFDCDGYIYYVDCPGDDAQETLNMAELYSPCCAEYVDPDWMICPCCKEHV
jgi:hypothetical protein